jgi:hypothetical protein
VGSTIPTCSSESWLSSSASDLLLVHPDEEELNPVSPTNDAISDEEDEPVLIVDCVINVADERR